jgi:hypothetical protein
MFLLIFNIVVKQCSKLQLYFFRIEDKRITEEILLSTCIDRYNAGPSYSLRFTPSHLE